MGKTIDQKLDEILTTVKDGFDDVCGRVDKVEGRLDKVEGDIKEMKTTMTTLATKDFVSEKLADLGAEIGKRINNANLEQRTFAKKLIEFLKMDGALKKEHVEELEEMLV